MQFTTPVGRLVYGSVWEGSDTDSKGQKRVIKTGPNAGKPAISFSFGVAFPKLLPDGRPNEEFNKFYREVIETCRAGYPQFYAGPIDPFTGKPGCIRPGGMALKIKDGDGIDANGKQNNTKEGWAGHWVVAFSGQFQPRVFDINIGLDPMNQLQDKSSVLPGDYVAVSGTCEPNTGSDTPGVYMNGNMVCKIGGGPRIVSGPKASDAFANVMGGTLPPGCVPGAAPSMPTPLPPGGAVPPAPGAPSVHAGAVTVPNTTGIVAPVAHDPRAKAIADGWIPHPQAAGYMYKGNDVKTDAEVLAMYPAPVPTVPTPPAVPMPPVPPAPPAVPTPPVVTGPTLTPAAMAAGFTTYQAAIAAGWNDEMLRGSGYLA
jgi:hypothetical protein